MLERLLGRLTAAAEGGRSSADAGRLLATDAGRLLATDPGRGMPKERRLTWLSRLLAVSGGISDKPSTCEPRLLLGRLMLLRVVTEAGRLSPSSERVLGDPFGVRFFDCGGNLDRADCTRSSIFCIRPLRLRIWYSESDRGRFGTPMLLSRETWRGFGGGFIALTSGVTALTLDAVEGPRACFG